MGDGAREGGVITRWSDRARSVRASEPVEPHRQRARPSSRPRPEHAEAGASQAALKASGAPHENAGEGEIPPLWRLSRISSSTVLQRAYRGFAGGPSRAPASARETPRAGRSGRGGGGGTAPSAERGEEKRRQDLPGASPRYRTMGGDGSHHRPVHVLGSSGSVRDGGRCLHSFFLVIDRIYPTSPSSSSPRASPSSWWSASLGYMLPSA